MKKVVITNAYTWYNKGDAGILLGIVNMLKKTYNDDVEFSVLSFTPEEDTKRYCKDKSIKEVKSNILNPHPYNHTKIGKLCAIIKLIFKLLYIQSCFIFCKNKLISKNKSLSLLNESDLIVVCGGGFLGGKKYDSLMHLYQMYINTKFNKPLIIMGTSIEPVKSKIVRYYTEKIIKKYDHVYAREKITYEYLATFMLEDKNTLIPDMAFMLPDDFRSNNNILDLKKKYKKVIGLTVRKWNFPNISGSKIEAMNNYLNTIAQFITKVSSEKGYCFVFIPQVIVDYGNDADVAKEIKNLLGKDIKDNFVIFEDDLTPVEIKNMIGNCDYFVGTRMHSNIFATSMCVPTVAIAYEKKTNGIMETVGLQDYIVEINDINLEKLNLKFENVVLNEEKIRKQLKVNIKNIRKEIEDKINQIMRLK